MGGIGADAVNCGAVESLAGVSVVGGDNFAGCEFRAAVEGSTGGTVIDTAWFAFSLATPKEMPSVTSDKDGASRAAPLPDMARETSCVKSRGVFSKALSDSLGSAVSDGNGKEEVLSCDSVVKLSVNSTDALPRVLFSGFSVIGAAKVMPWGKVDEIDVEVADSESSIVAIVLLRDCLEACPI